MEGREPARNYGGHVCTVATVGQQSAQRLSEYYYDASQHHPDREHRPDPRTDPMADVSGPAKHAEPKLTVRTTPTSAPPMSDRSQQTQQRDRNEEDPALGRPETPGDDQHEDEAADAAADDPDEVEGSAAGDDSQISTGGDARPLPRAWRIERNPSTGPTSSMWPKVTLGAPGVAGSGRPRRRRASDRLVARRTSSILPPQVAICREQRPRQERRDPLIPAIHGRAPRVVNPQLERTVLEPHGVPGHGVIRIQLNHRPVDEAELVDGYSPLPRRGCP